MQPLQNGKVNEREDNYSGIYIGTVVKQCDDSGACKVFVHGVYPDDFRYIPDQLPTAYPCMPLWGGGRSEDKAFPNGIYQYPDLNTTVLVFFASNDINRPYFFAMMDNDKKQFDHDHISIHYGRCYIKLKKGGDLTIYADNDIDIIAGRDINVKCGRNLNEKVGHNRSVNVEDSSTAKANKYCAVGNEAISMAAPNMKLLTSEGYFGTGEGQGKVVVRSGATAKGEGLAYVGPCIRILELSTD